MRRFLIPLLAANTLLGTLAGGALLLRIEYRLFNTMGSAPSWSFVGALLLSPLLGLLVARFGPQRPVGLLQLEAPIDSESKARAKARLKMLLRIIGATFFIGLAAGLLGTRRHESSAIGGLVLACSGTMAVILAPWIAVYARWFRIDWF